MSRPTDDETFLRRWSRRKHEEENKPLAPQPAPPAGESEKEREASAPPLPPLEKLTPQSDFSAFMHPKVQDSLRRVALKKLFADPHFNVMDLNEAYSGDWTGGEPITQEMLAQLNQARTLLFSDEEKKKLEEQAAQEVASEQETKETKEAKEDKPDEPRRQDA